MKRLISYNGVNRCNISACCNGKLSHAGKFVWSYGIKTD